METKMKLNNPEKAREYFEAKMAFTTGPVELNRMIESGVAGNIIDVRAAEDYAKGHVPTAVNLPKDKWDSLAGLSKERLNVIYCYSQVCHLAATAAVKIAAQGFPVMELEGGFKTWKEHNLAVEQEGQKERDYQTDRFRVETTERGQTFRGNDRDVGATAGVP